MSVESRNPPFPTCRYAVELGSRRNGYEYAVMTWCVQAPRVGLRTHSRGRIIWVTNRRDRKRTFRRSVAGTQQGRRSVNCAPMHWGISRFTLLVRSEETSNFLEAKRTLRGASGSRVSVNDTDRARSDPWKWRAPFIPDGRRILPSERAPH